MSLTTDTNRALHDVFTARPGVPGVVLNDDRLQAVDGYLAGAIERGSEAENRALLSRIRDVSPSLRVALVTCSTIKAAEHLKLSDGNHVPGLNMTPPADGRVGELTGQSTIRQIAAIGLQSAMHVRDLATAIRGEGGNG